MSDPTDGYKLLAVAVLLHALHDAQSYGPHAAVARQWLTEPSEILTHWCACAGLLPEVVIRSMRLRLA